MASAGERLRDLAYGAGALVTAPLWLIGMARSGKLRTDWRGRLGRGPAVARPRSARPGSARRRILVYGVSVGEIAAARTLVAELERRGHEVVVAAMTDTGIARAEQLYGDAHAVVRWPYDFSGAVAGLLDRVRPDALVLMELEVWPNALSVCERRGVPVAVVNGRLSARSFRGYRRARPLLRSAFARLAAVGAQTPAYGDRFVAMGTPADRVRVTGSMKWDSATAGPVPTPETRSLRDRLGLAADRPVVVAGSTAPGEDRLLLAGLRDADTGRVHGTQLVLAPRKPEWFDGAAAEAAAMGFRVRRWSEAASHPASPTDPFATDTVFLLDTIGVLRTAYALAAEAHAAGHGGVAVVGRSFTGTLFGSDVSEPVGVGAPTVIGPHFADFEAMMEPLAAAGAVVIASEPWAAIGPLLGDPAAAADRVAAGHRVIAEQRGAVGRSADLVEALIAGSRGAPARR